ncbi:MAG: hypothetical protein KBT28_12525 [Bacteroidales bacterium]|nr:hypothetical protein [Candidatus Colimorpha merdihippi]
MSVITMVLKSKWLHSDHAGAKAFRKSLGITSVPIERITIEEYVPSEFERLMRQRIGALDRK